MGEYAEVVDAVYADGLYGEPGQQVQLRVVRTHNEDGTEQILYEPINEDETSAAVGSIQYHHHAARVYANDDDDDEDHNDDTGIVEHVVIT